MRKVCVLGLGYIGLPTASVFATHGLHVVGVDINDRVLQVIAQGESHIAEPGLRTLVEAAVKSGSLRVQKTPEPADAFIICVPTPLTQDHRADLRYVEAAAHSIVPYLKKGNLVILESTVPPGTTSGLVKAILEKSGLQAGVDFYLAYCPERVLPGKILIEIVQNSRIIGGIDQHSAQMAQSLYERFVEGEIYLTDATTAEMVKLAENTFRDVNIALANELARICAELDIDVWRVIELANKHPRVHLHRPGPGVGGHCIAIDPWFIVEKRPEKAKLIRTSREINDEQPSYIFELIRTLTADVAHPKVAVFGVAYKGDVDDTRESPALVIIRLLQEHGYEVAAYDPHVKEFELPLSGLQEACMRADCLAILAAHSDFRQLDPQTLRPLVRTPRLLDACHIIEPRTWEQSGFQVFVLGSGANKIQH
jgi:UDP-N-acetyl-D-mannosaminuronic acid dehydrogenase